MILIWKACRNVLRPYERIHLSGAITFKWIDFVIEFLFITLSVLAEPRLYRWQAKKQILKTVELAERWWGWLTVCAINKDRRVQLHSIAFTFYLASFCELFTQATFCLFSNVEDNKPPSNIKTVTNCDKNGVEAQNLVAAVTQRIFHLFN